MRATLPTGVALVLLSLVLHPGCGSNIKGIRFSHDLAARAPVRPATPRSTRGKPLFPKLLTAHREVGANRLPALERSALGFLLQRVQLPSGLIVDDFPADASTMLTLSLLQAGLSRFSDLAPMREVSAAATGKATGGLKLLTRLDKLAMLGLHGRVDHVLWVQDLRCGVRKVPVKVPLHWKAKDLQRYRATRKQFLEQIGAYRTAVQQAQARLKQSYEADLARYSREWGERGFWTEIGDALGGRSDDRLPARERYQRARTQLGKIHAWAEKPVLSAEDLMAQLQRRTSKRQVPLARCQVAAVISNVRSGTTIWVYQGTSEAVLPAHALSAAIEGLVKALTARSRLPRARVISNRSSRPMQ